MQSYDIDDGVDENGVQINLGGSLWKMQKTMLGGVVWKRRWVTCDSVQFIIWNKPTMSEHGAEPKYKFKLRNCRINTDSNGSVGRQNAFVVTDLKTNVTACIATDTPKVFRKWVDFITSDEDYDEMLRKVEEKRREEEELMAKAAAEAAELDSGSSSMETDSVNEVDEAHDSKTDLAASFNAVAKSKTGAVSPGKRKKRKKEKLLTLGETIVRYFQERDISSREDHPVIATDDIQGLFHLVDPTLDKRIIPILQRDTSSDTCLALPDFLEWYGNYLMKMPRTLEQGAVPVNEKLNTGHAKDRDVLETLDPLLLHAKESGQNKSMNFMTYNSSDEEFSLCTGMVNPELRSPLEAGHVTDKKLMESLIPEIKRLVLLDSDDSINFTEDEEQVISYEWNDIYQHLIDDAGTEFVFPRTFNDDDARELNQERARNNVSAALNQAAFAAEFLRTATEGAKIIVDEYVLPDEYKTIKSVNKRAQQKLAEHAHVEPPTYQQDDNRSDEGEDIQDIQDIQNREEYDEDSDFSSREELNKANISGDAVSDISGVMSADEMDASVVSRSSRSTFNDAATKRGLFSNLEDAEDLEMGQGELFSYKGLLLRVNAHGVHRLHDEEPSSERVQRLSALDAVLHQTAGNEHRGLLYAKQAADGVYREHLQDFVHDEGEGVGDAAATLTRMRTLLSTVVDCGGFRVSVTCPVDVDEERTLVHGFCNSITPELSDPADDSMCDLDQSDRLFVTALGAVRGHIPRLASQLNIQLTHRTCLGTKATLREIDDGHVGPVPVETLSKWMEMHRCADGQIYMLNFDGLLVPDIPRSETHDIETRRLRPEFIRNYQERLSPDCFSDAENHIHLRAVNDSPSSEGESFTRKRMDILQRNLSASSHLYTIVIPQLARDLDTTVVMPLDSTSFTNTLHSYGVNMRQCGVLYSVCTSQHAKELILVEVVARTCKVLLNNKLRMITRKGKATTMNAEFRNRSTERDYREFMDHVTKEKRKYILVFFNLVLGSSKAGDHFWSQILPDAVFQKFGLLLPTAKAGIQKYSIINVATLFQAMQLHTGVRFHDSARYELSSSANHTIFRYEDIANFSLPSAKPLSFASNKVTSTGYVGELDSLVLPSLAAGMIDEALSLLRLRMSLQLTTMQHTSSMRDAADCQRTTYLLALTLYKAGNYTEAIQILNNQLNQTSKYTAMSGRYYMLMMCCFFKAETLPKHMHSAMIAFEAAKAIFAFVLAPSHPVQALLMGALADNYIQIGAINEAVVSLTAAVELTQRALTDTSQILTAAYEMKLGRSLLTIMKKERADFDSGFKNAEKAIEYVSDALATYARLATDGAGVTREIIDCLYTLTQINIHIGRHEDALAHAKRCKTVALAEYGKRMKNKNHAARFPNESLPLLPPAAAACLLLYSDLLVANQSADVAVDTLQVLWSTVRRSPSQFDNIGHIYMNIAVRMFTALFAQQPYTTRSLLQTIALEVEDPGMPQHGIGVRGAWAKAQEVVFEATWTNEPRSYFNSVVQGVMKAEIEGNSVEDVSEFSVHSQMNPYARGEGKANFDGVDGDEAETDVNSLNIYALQVAVIMRLITRHSRQVAELRAVD